MSESDKLAWNEFAIPMWEKMTAMMERWKKSSRWTLFNNYGDNAIGP